VHLWFEQRFRGTIPETILGRLSAPILCLDSPCHRRTPRRRRSA
jgi:hypothetical protein